MPRLGHVPLMLVMPGLDGVPVMVVVAEVVRRPPRRPVDHRVAMLVMDLASVLPVMLPAVVAGERRPRGQGERPEHAEDDEGLLHERTPDRSFLS